MWTWIFLLSLRVKLILKNKEAFKICLPAIVGKGYKDFWHTKARYRVCKGSRGSKKSKTTALNMIVRLFKYPQSNGLCVRRYSNTLRDSVYSDLKWAIHRLGLDAYFDCMVSSYIFNFNITFVYYLSLLIYLHLFYQFCLLLLIIGSWTSAIFWGKSGEVKSFVSASLQW